VLLLILVEEAHGGREQPLVLAALRGRLANGVVVIDCARRSAPSVPPRTRGRTHRGRRRGVLLARVAVILLAARALHRLLLLLLVLLLLLLAAT
jgi:hypothetical protein